MFALSYINLHLCKVSALIDFNTLKPSFQWWCQLNFCVYTCVSQLLLWLRLICYKRKCVLLRTWKNVKDMKDPATSSIKELLSNSNWNQMNQWEIKSLVSNWGVNSLRLFSRLKLKTGFSILRAWWISWRKQDKEYHKTLYMKNRTDRTPILKHF